MLPMQPEPPAEGNLEVVALLENWLARAKLGRLDFVAIAATEGPKHCLDDYTGAWGRQMAINWAIDALKDRIRKEAHILRAKAPDERIPANLYRFNVVDGPMSFDVTAWLIIAEMARRREGAPAPLKVGFNFGADRDINRALRSRRRLQFFDNVVRPLVKMIGGVEDAQASEDGRQLEIYTNHPITWAARAGEAVPLFQPSAEAVEAVKTELVKDRPPVVITLREAEYESHRNSNFAEWLRFAEYLKANGERVVFVRDTARANEPIKGFEVCPGAALDLDIRLALYEACKCSLTVANGPWCLNLFGSGPWLSFVALNAFDTYAANTPSWYQTYHGIREGEQYPWSKENQRIIWKLDTFANLCAAWEEFTDRKESDHVHKQRHGNGHSQTHLSGGRVGELRG